MEWSNNIFSVIIVILVMVILPIVFRKKRSGVQKREELYQHLQSIGVKAILLENGNDKEAIGLSRRSGQKSAGIIELRKGNIDSINLVSTSSQYGVNYFCDYLLASPNITGGQTLKKTRLAGKKSSPLWGNIVAVEWKGDRFLAQGLNFDYKLNDNLLQAGFGSSHRSIAIFPEPKQGYVRIRTSYFLPSSQMLETINTIARHIRSY